MAVHRLDVHPSALAEFKSALMWYLERNETAAFKFVDEVDRAIGLILDSPVRWPKGIHGTRKIVLNRFPFVIVYREKDNAIQVLAIAHGRRRPDYWRDRL